MHISQNVAVQFFAQIATLVQKIHLLIPTSYQSFLYDAHGDSPVGNLNQNKKGAQLYLYTMGFPQTNQISAVQTWSHLNDKHDQKHLHFSQLNDWRIGILPFQDSIETVFLEIA